MFNDISRHYNLESRLMVVKLSTLVLVISVVEFKLFAVLTLLHVGVSLSRLLLGWKLSLY